ncbi:MAG: hypothetical protein DRH56_07135 [Deltaproteobacteria bacterium]|nr:MAG: hypothetical protein DRH56_07135 [Deltaproteobacteria bacterium]
MDNLFSPGLINGMSLPNRFVRSATWEGLATEEGAVTPRLTDLMVRLVGGGVGLITDGTADYISMSRPLIREPGLLNRWKSGDLTRAACLSDNRCFQPAREGDGVYCVTEKRGV